MVKKAVSHNKGEEVSDSQIDSCAVNITAESETVMTFVNIPKQPYVVTEIAPIDPDPLDKNVKKQTKIGFSKEKDVKYYKMFDFFFNRSCFRIMTEFYKLNFNKFYTQHMLALKKDCPDTWKRKQKEGYHETSKSDMDSLVQRFIANTFG